ncbi:hypothetical protein DICPUDRAFT_158071 [Dictyostelium purpureum]|uniref:ER membrane protein complex subunit 7 beta-sandwich domain-containing protein n=1 Tax=Dictyostelium purpureum TaxID=5786 RepID=F1A0R6_DICPU|nr:uncharacterized protein DICPUDRAFT_158071 [Dictyostelium purpureum]EGC30224.1 hypothetical protein DICPUDRAFT_158071 [Dictyostelium purpureum]|eukprot:XP_003293260.1 hypothetical protein DICPUDRAFT_158071 [Dictyostelium purpureum]
MGLYSLEIESMQYFFPSYKVDILGGKKSIKVRAAENETAVLPLPLKIKAVHKIPYFQQHVPFSIFGIIQNPMIISTLLPVFLIFALPKMTSFITNDEETRETLKASQPTLIQQVPELPKFKVITNKLIE